MKTWPKSTSLFLLLISVAIAMEYFFITGGVQLNLADEGFFWYGVDRVFHGDFPIRDFRSYEPARYYWSAFGFELLGPGLIQLRITETVIQIIGLFFGLWAASHVLSNRWMLALLSLVLTLWMFPGYRYFDIILPLVGVAVGLQLIKNPNNRSHLIAGFFVGLSGIFGRNHGLYLTISFLILIFCAGWEKRTYWLKLMENLGFWMIGGLIGYLPMIVMFIWVKGFFSAFIVTLAKQGTANIFLPIAWPWRIPLSSGLKYFDLGLSEFIFGFFLLALPIIYLFWIFLYFKSLIERS